ncbi:aspartate aminotransferase family protein [Shouchella miscanthi]|uniref:Aminotransferase class III-fold pyridoxal phosphate-dependent enzyme n=1 Tax=Shouchella miscanthi TaxID=2598861 RepID=A0ABU6NL22_9BACI|nr:aminotransferase class III-fold pyridoxal phosphate-dependent enzyme [Shouchella miscanthi]MED4127457.1 aminotransferase class III-fold pyridoxal phosphate-dependent enzyme [Shouchella miscanthi]
MDWLKRDEQALMSTYRRLPLVISEGKGSFLIDEEGRQYLDFITGLAVNVVGHSHPAILKTLQTQGSKFLHISNLYVNKPAVELAEKLSERTIGGKVFFANSGAEATEAVIKLIHKWSKQHDFSRKGVVVLKRSFHGRTLGAMKLTRQEGVYQDFPLHDLPVYEVEPEDAKGLEDILIQKKPAAVVMEPVLGSGGVVPLSHEYVQTVSQLCATHHVLFCMDEIQTGMGRTGTLFAYMQANVQPDVILFAKGIGGGLPLGGMIVSPRLTHLFAPGDHGTTFAPSPLSCALGLTVLELLEEGLLHTSRMRAEQLQKGLSDVQAQFPHILDRFRGRGMMMGLPTKGTPKQAAFIQRRMIEKGVLVDLTQGTIIRLLPPLVVTSEEVDLFIAHFTSVLQEVEQELNV